MDHQNPRHEAFGRAPGERYHSALRAAGSRAERGCEEATMAAYPIVEHTITDPAKFQEYGDKIRPLVAKYGGRSLARSSIELWRQNIGCRIE
jgi:hypothetical protein